MSSAQRRDFFQSDASWLEISHEKAQRHKEKLTTNSFDTSAAPSTLLVTSLSASCAQDKSHELARIYFTAEDTENAESVRGIEGSGYQVARCVERSATSRTSGKQNTRELVD